MGSILNDATLQAIAAEENSNDYTEDLDAPFTDPEDPEENYGSYAGGFQLPDLDFLKARTGDGSIEDYIEHPLNNHGSRGVAQILRGLTGMFGSLDLGIVDVVLGAFEFTKEKKAEKKAAADQQLNIFNR